MPPGRLNPRLAKTHRTYTIDEAAKLFGVHRNTVRNWIASGLPPIDDGRPVLIKGSALSAYLQSKQQLRKTICRSGTIYCVGCRKAQEPAGGVADCVPLGGCVGDLQGRCPTCGALMHRRVNLARLSNVGGSLTIRIAKPPPHLGESTEPNVNCHFEGAPDDGQNPQR